MNLKLLSIFVFITICHGFLLDSSAPNATSGSSLSDQRYIYLMDLMGQERQNQQKMAQMLLSVQNELKSFRQQFSKFNHSQETIQELEISHLKSVSMVMKETIRKLEREVNQVKNDNKILQEKNTKLQQDMHSLIYNSTSENHDLLRLKNESTTIEKLEHGYNSLQQEVANLKQEVLKLANESLKRDEENSQLESAINMCQNETSKVKQEMYSLTSYLNQKVDKINTNPILTLQSQDIYKLFNQTSLAWQKIAVIENETQKLNKEFDILSHHHNITAWKVDNALQGISTTNQIVALTSSSIHGPVDPDKVVQFPYIKTQYGINNVSGFTNSGIFTCEIPGVYLFSAFILASSNDGRYAMYKNNNIISKVETSHVGTNSLTTFHTGTGVLAVILDVGDTLYIKSYFRQIYVMSGHSCITIIKIG